jgi:hypothetical protein
MFDCKSLIGKCLVAIKIGHNHEKVHPAWQDDTNKDFLICYDMNLVFNDEKIYSVKPCEVDIIDRYPGLGLALEDINKVELSIPFTISDLPMRVSRVIESDHLGEDVINQYILILESGIKIIIRHVYPPMSMGIKIVAINA